MVTDFLAKVFSDARHPAGLNKVCLCPPHGPQKEDTSNIYIFTQDIDLEQLATETDDRLENLRRQWFSIFEQSDMNNVQNRFRIGLLKLAYSYSRLVALSYGFQHAFGKSNVEDNPFLTRVSVQCTECTASRIDPSFLKCIRAASDVIDAMVDDAGMPSQSEFHRSRSVLSRKILNVV